MYTKLKNKTTVTVIDRFGYDLDTITLTNTAAAELYPDMEHIRIQCTADKSARPKWDEPMNPVQDAGKAGYGNYAGGSAVKRGQTIGMQEDSLTHMTRTDEDGQRVQRWLFASDVFGGFKGDLKISILMQGDMLASRLGQSGVVGAFELDSQALSFGGVEAVFVDEGVFEDLFILF